MALLPGLIDTHNHSSLMRGVVENQRMVDWLPVYDLEHRACMEEDAYHAARLCYLECLKNGTTTIMDMYRFMDRCAEAAGELGIRLHCAPYAADVLPYTFFDTTETNEALIKVIICHITDVSECGWDLRICSIAVNRCIKTQ